MRLCFWSLQEVHCVEREIYACFECSVGVGYVCLDFVCLSGVVGLVSLRWSICWLECDE